MSPSIDPTTLRTELFIDGAWRSATGGATFPVENPATNEILAHVADGGHEDASPQREPQGLYGRGRGQVAPEGREPVRQPVLHDCRERQHDHEGEVADRDAPARIRGRDRGDGRRRARQRITRHLMRPNDVRAHQISWRDPQRRSARRVRGGFSAARLGSARHRTRRERLTVSRGDPGRAGPRRAVPSAGPALAALSRSGHGSEQLGALPLPCRRRRARSIPKCRRCSTSSPRRRSPLQRCSRAGASSSRPDF